MKTLFNVLSLIVIVGSFISIAKVSIVFNPLRISIMRPYALIGVLLMIVGSSLIIYEIKRYSEHQGFLRGVKELSEAISQEIKNVE